MGNPKNEKASSNEPSRTKAPEGFVYKGPTKPVPVKIVVVSGADEGLEVSLEKSLDVGTDPSCDMELHDPAVSRKHVSFARIGGRIIVKDRGSRNGTFLGDTRVVEADVPLGAILNVGDSAIVVQPRWYVREVRPSVSRSFGELIGESVAMREVFSILERVAPTDLTVLIQGESGTGKELVGRSVHKGSLRAERPYVIFDCGSVPAELAESELFGHKKGSFSGAVADRTGAFLQAEGGTIYLDEIGELPSELQPKLLRVLETRQIKSIGDDKMRKIDVRVIAATNRDLAAEVRRGNFRNDLLYRLEVVRINLPPLRHRPEDIKGLIEHFIKEKLPEDDQIGGENLEKLLAYSWHGNVRELRNTLMRAMALCQKPDAPPVRFKDLIFNVGHGQPPPLTGSAGYPGVSSPMTYKEAKELLLADFDKAYVEALLDRYNGNVTKSAEAAALSRKHIYELIHRAEKLNDPEKD